MSLSKLYTSTDKQQLKVQADKHISGVVTSLNTRIGDYKRLIAETKALIPEVADLNLDNLDGNSEFMDAALGRIMLYSQMERELEAIQDSPYFIRLDIVWKETGEPETLYISKFSDKKLHIYSWISPISTLRYGQIGEASYQKPNGGVGEVGLDRKDSFIITGRQIVFMTSNDQEHDRQVIFQKHLEQRRDFLLPEIVAELDRLQDQIIRSDPKGSFLISGPAGSGKTTLALHRVAYLVLTPEFQDFFEPERITIFVADDGAINYFGKLLPELGINGVRITTFMEWATMIANSRFRASKIPNRFISQNIEEAVSYIAQHNPIPQIHPRLILDEYRKLKQQMIMPLKLSEGSQIDVYPKLHELYAAEALIENPLWPGFVNYLKFQKQHKILDEVDLTILLMSLEHPIEPFVHTVVDEVQNWLPEQLQAIKSLAHNAQKSITFIGDIRQKTKAFSVNSWEEVDPIFSSTGPKSIELLKVYRNTKQILEFLKSKGYAFEISAETRSGKEVMEINLERHDPKLTESNVKSIINQIHNEKGKVQIGVLAKYKSSLDNLQHLNYDHPNVHVLTIEAAQGLEFHSVIILDVHELQKDGTYFTKELGELSAAEYAAQNKHLFYVAATRAQEELYVIS